MRKRRNVDRLVVQKIVNYCDKVSAFMNRFGATFEAYGRDEAYQLACSACILQIGELTTRLSDEFKVQHADIPWQQIKGLRNIHAHDYESINLELMWEILTQNIPTLKSQLEKILAAEVDTDEH